MIVDDLKDTIQAAELNGHPLDRITLTFEDAYKLVDELGMDPYYLMQGHCWFEGVYVRWTVPTK